MKKKRIIPCLDIKDGRVVKGVKFTSLKDAGNPVEIAAAYDKAGADEIVFLDISATQEGRSTVIQLVRDVANSVSIPFIVGGGISSVQQAKNILDAGANKISIASAAIDNPDLISQIKQELGNVCIVAIDVSKQDNNSWTVLKHGGTVDTGIDVIKWAKQVEKLGASEILLTSLDKDGTKSGYDIALTKAVAQGVNIPVIASGGAGSMQDFYDALTQGKADGALAASLFHFHDVDISELKQFLHKKGISVNL